MPDPTGGRLIDDTDSVRELLGLHTLGRVVENIDFIEADLDVAINKVVNSGCYMFLFEILKAFMAECPSGSAGRTFAIDFVLHNGNWLGNNVKVTNKYEHLGMVDDEEEVVNELASRVIEVMEAKLNKETATHEIKKILITGFFEARNCTDNYDLGAFA